MSKKCSKCGYENDVNAKFCLECGNVLENLQENNICPKCGYSNNIGSNFCKSCGSSLSTGGNSNVAVNNTTQGNTIPPQRNNPNEISCPYCGSMISAYAEKCRFCGEWVKRSSSRPHTPQSGGETHTLAIVLGYIFTLLGGWIGLIIAIYLLTRNNENAKTHGTIQLILFFVVLLFWFAIFL